MSKESMFAMVNKFLILVYNQQYANLHGYSNCSHWTVKHGEINFPQPNP